MSIEWQRAMTPDVVLFSTDARGKVAQALTDALGGGGEKYFFRNTFGKVFLVKNHQVAPPDVGAHHECRMKFKAAVAAWQALSPSAKEAWGLHSYARQFNLPGYHTFISFFMRDRI